MASAGGMKKFFRENKKKNTAGGVSKPGAAKKTKHSASSGSDIVHHPALISHASLDLQDEKEEILRHFDMNMAYGPCIGMGRLERWERADKLGLKPPTEVEKLLRMEKVNPLCLWDDGRV